MFNVLLNLKVEATSQKSFKTVLFLCITLTSFNLPVFIFFATFIDNKIMRNFSEKRGKRKVG